MKIYFANNQYLNIGDIHEEYRVGFKHLTFSLINAKINFDTIFNFLNNPQNLSKITVVNDKGDVIATWVDVYHSLYSLTHTTTSNGDKFINVQLSTTDDGMEVETK